MTEARISADHVLLRAASRAGCGGVYSLISWHSGRCAPFVPAVVRRGHAPGPLRRLRAAREAHRPPEPSRGFQPDQRSSFRTPLWTPLLGRLARRIPPPEGSRRLDKGPAIPLAPLGRAAQSHDLHPRLSLVTQEIVLPPQAFHRRARLSDARR